MPSTLLDQLAEQIRAVCLDGFCLDEQAWQYLQTTLADPTPESVKKIMLQDDDCESDSLLELLFYPTEPMQIRLEPLIGTRTLTEKEQRRLVDLLSACPVETSLYFPVLQKHLHLKIPEHALERFVHRLNLNVNLPLKLTRVIDQCLIQEQVNLAKVRLRNSKRTYTDHQADFLIQIFKNLKPTHPQFWPCLDFVLNIVSEVPAAPLVYDFLMAKKNFYFQSVSKAEQFLEKLRRSNMETLMMQGERAAFIHPEEGRKAMTHIDLISRSLFGRSDHFQTPLESDIQIDEKAPLKNLSKVIDYLS